MKQQTSCQISHQPLKPREVTKVHVGNYVRLLLRWVESIEAKHDYMVNIFGSMARNEKIPHRNTIGCHQSGQYVSIRMYLTLNFLWWVLL